MSADFQNRIGYVDVKSSPVYFDLQRFYDFSTTETPISFDYERLNVDGAVNSTSGKFTAPLDEIYSFSFTEVAYIPPVLKNVYLFVSMYLNGNPIGSGLADGWGNSSGFQRESFSLQSTLDLQKGNQIWLEIDIMPTGAFLRGNGHTHFSGSLLEEIIEIA